MGYIVYIYYHVNERWVSRFLCNNGNIVTEESLKSGHIQFGAMWMLNPDDKHPNRPGFDPNTTEKGCHDALSAKHQRDCPCDVIKKKFSAGIEFRRQNLTSEVDPRAESVKPVEAVTVMLWPHRGRWTSLSHQRADMFSLYTLIHSEWMLTTVCLRCCTNIHLKYNLSSHFSHSEGIVSRRQNLTPVDVRFWRLKLITALKE